MLDTTYKQTDTDSAANLDSIRMKTCSTCRNKIGRDFAFCRWCGEKQVVTLQKYLTDIETRMLDNSRRSYNTSPLTSERAAYKETEVIYANTLGLSVSSQLVAEERLSQQLVKSVVEAFEAQSFQANNDIVKKASAIILSIFVWFILTLSAPIDAIAMVKNIVK